jgi:GNAT superfamily N-acetyltransferase
LHGKAEIITVLALLVTAEEHRRQGAGSLLVKWGLEKQRETGLICYLQASDQGKSLYIHYGFQDIDTVVFDLDRYGLKGVEKITEMVRSLTESGDCTCQLGIRQRPLRGLSI